MASAHPVCVVRAVPAAIRNKDPLKVLRDLVDELVDSSVTRRLVPTREQIWITSACHMAVKAGEEIIREGEEGLDLYVIRQGSMVVEKTIGGKPVFLSYLPAGSYVGEMAMLDGGRRTATVRAAIKSEVIRLDGALCFSPQ